MSILCPVTLEWTSSNTTTLHRTNRLENGWMSGYIINKPPDSYVINDHKHWTHKYLHSCICSINQTLGINGCMCTLCISIYPSESSGSIQNQYITPPPSVTISHSELFDLNYVTITATQQISRVNMQDPSLIYQWSFNI